MEPISQQHVWVVVPELLQDIRMTRHIPDRECHLSLARYCVSSR